MKRVLIGILLIGTLTLMACSDEEEFEIEQEIVFIYHSFLWGEGGDLEQNWGFFIDNQGNTVDFQLSGMDWEYVKIEKLYSYLLELDNPQRTQYISLADLKTCYDNLLQIDENAEIEEGDMEFDSDSVFWYGVIDNGEAVPSFILLSEDGSVERRNTDEHAKNILNILLR